MRISWFATAAAATLAFCGSAHADNLVTNGDFTSLSNGPGQISHGITSATEWSTTGYNFVFHDGNVGGPDQYSGTLQLWTGAPSGGNGGASSWNGLTASGTGNFLAMDGDYNTAAVKQTITGLTVGDTYTLSFNYAFAQQYGFDQDTQQQLKVTLGNDINEVLTGSPTQACNGGTHPLTGNCYYLPQHGFSGWFTESDTFTASATSEVLSFLAAGNKQVPPFALVSDVSLPGAPGPGPATGAAAVLGVLALAYARRRLGEQA
ncbi:MAG: hypothetical protein WBS22_00270 [Methylocystis sp.]